MGAYELVLLIIGTVLMGGGGLLILVLGIWWLAADLKMRDRTTGTVLDAELDCDGNTQLEVVFTTPAGTSQRFVDSSPSGRFGPRVSGRVGVRYDANDPGSARIASIFGSVFGDVFLILFGAATLVAYVVAVVDMT